MIILPVGTKSALALKPKVTITLIAICIIVHFLSSMSGGDVYEDLFEVERDLYSKQVHLYLIENDEFYLENGFIEQMQQSALDAIRYSSDYEELESNIFMAMGSSFTCFKELEEFGNTLYKRDASFYEHDPQLKELHASWNTLQAKEDEVLGGLVSFSLGLVPRKMNRFWTFFTHMFLHGDIWHLLGNMLFLWVVGCLLEDTWGRGPFLAFYLTGGMIAGWAHCLQDTGSAIPLIGASGAIAAAMGAFTVRHFMTKIKFFYFFMFFFRPFWGTFHLPAFVFLPFWFMQQVAMKSLTDFAGGTGVAYLAHIVGYLVGVIVALTFKATGFEQKMIDPIVKRKQVKEGVLKDPRFDEACDLLRQGAKERARMLFSQLLNENPNDYCLSQDIAVVYRESGMDAECGVINQSTLKNLLLKSRMEEAATLALDMINSGECEDTNPQLLLKTGKYLSNEGRAGEAHDVYRSIIRTNASPTVTAKTSIALAKLLSSKMQNFVDAVNVLEEAKGLEISPVLVSTIGEVQASIEADARQYA